MSTLGTDARNVLPPRTTEREEQRSAEVELGGSMVEAVAGIAGVVLAILTLVGIFPIYLAPIAAIAIGAGLLFEGSAIAARYNKLWRETGQPRAAEGELGGGMTAELFGGVAGIVLGILALLHLVPMVTLSAVAFLCVGASTLLSGAALSGKFLTLLNRRW